MARRPRSRFEIGAPLAGMAGVLAATLVNGWLSEPVARSTGLVLAVLGGAGGGALVGRSRVDRLSYAAAGVLGALGVFVASLLYLKGRPSPFELELLLPLLLGALPGLIAAALLRALRGRPTLRLGVAATLLLGAVLLPVLWFPADAQPGRDAPVVPRRRTPLRFAPDERAALERLFGEPGRAFLKRVDLLNGMAQIYGTERVVARAWPAVERLDRALAGLHREMQRQVAAGAEPDRYRVFLDVEQITLTFLGTARRLRAELEAAGRVPRPDAATSSPRRP